MAAMLIASNERALLPVSCFDGGSRRENAGIGPYREHGAVSLR